MELEFKKYHPHLFIKSLAKQLGTISQRDCLEEIIVLPAKVGNGKITGFKFSDGISLLLFDCELNENISLQFANDLPSPLLFNFVMEGQITHKMKSQSISYQLGSMQSSVTACQAACTQSFELNANVKMLFAIISINRKKYLKKIDCLIDEMPPKMSAVFKDEESKTLFFHQANYSIITARAIKKIATDKHCGLVRSIFVESKVLDLLARQVRRVQGELTMLGKYVKLRKEDVDKIKSARNILINDLKNPPVIETLAKQVGLNQQKLKAGFKVVFETTINRYLTKERLEMASLSLLQKNSVKETAEKVGYTNLSHFARLFKNKYGVLPKEYLKSIELKIEILT